MARPYPSQCCVYWYYLHLVLTLNCIHRHVALLEIQHNTFQLTPIPLRTVRPFVLDEVILSEAAETEGLDTSNQIEVMKFLRGRVSNAVFEFEGLFLMITPAG